MKITILSQYFIPEMGAPQNRLYELTQELRKLGWQVEIITAMPNYPTGKIFEAYRGKFYLLEKKEFIIHRYWLYPSKSSRSLPRILSMLSFSFTSLFSIRKIMTFRPAYLMVESPPLTLAFTGWILAKFSKSRLIMNVSDLWPLSAKELGAISDGFLYKTLEKLETFLYEKSDVCTGQSQQIVDYIAQRKKGKVWLLRNGVDTTRFPRIERHNRNYKIVYAGLLGVAQGILELCKNIDFADQGLEFHIYGSGNEQDAITQFISENPAKGIFYRGVLRRDDIPKVLPGYDAALVALVRNIFGAVPSKIYEAMAAGLPIVFSGDGEGAHLIIENKVGWVSRPNDLQGLKHNLKHLRQLSADDLMEFKLRAMQVAASKFDRQKQVLNFHQLLLQNQQL
jgi:glycosyltransferase involved in cell wall biosynthesis